MMLGYHWSEGDANYRILGKPVKWKSVRYLVLEFIMSNNVVRKLYITDITSKRNKTNLIKK